MWSKKLRLLGTLSVLALALAPQVAEAQDATSGAIAGTIHDKSSGESAIGVAVIVTSVDRGNSFSAMSNGEGYYKVSSLPPGMYTVEFVHGETSVVAKNVRVFIGRTSNRSPVLSGTTITIHGREVLVDTTDGAIRTRIPRDLSEKLPTPGLSFVHQLSGIAGADQDAVGPSFSGSTGPENKYVIDGVNTTGLSYATVGTPIINEFIEETEVITGGYMAEHGRSTGGIVNVVTRTGTNEFHGTIFTNFTNSLLQKRTAPAPVQGWIDVEQNLAYDLSLGATLGGPLIKDKLWFFVGIAPRVISSNTERITKRRTDCRIKQADGTLSECDPVNNADTIADVDEDGRFIYEELDRSTLNSSATEYQFVSKVNYAPTPEHAGQLTFSGTPSSQRRMGVAGEPQAVSRDIEILTTDLSAKWTSKFNDYKTTFEGVFGMHRTTMQSGSISSAANSVPKETLLNGNFGEWAAGTNTLTGQPRESQATIAGCQDSMDPEKDPYLYIENCPDRGIGYAVGGAGFLGDEEEQRTSGRLSLLQRIEAAGSHELKAGVDFESAFLNKKRLISGGSQFTNFQDRDTIEVFRYIALAPADGDPERFDDLCGFGRDSDPVACDHTPPGDVKGRTLNLAAYLQDSWMLKPNLTLNVGLRYEEQRLRNAEHLRGTTDPHSGQTFGNNALALKNMWAPRLGVLYDWTKEARSKLFASWGRYYESMPMDINDRAFGGESWMRSTFDSSDAQQCGEVDPNLSAPSGAACVASGAAPGGGEQLTGAAILVAPGLKAQYLDESILGVEYEILDDLKIGASYQNRRLGRVLEDVSTDNAATYVLANPGSWSSEEEERLLQKIAKTSDAAELERLNGQLEQFRGIRKFDKPRRDYNAVTLTASNRFSEKFFVRSSYTYARTEGNYQGLYSSSNGQVDPNITSLFDLEELMANRDGPLPQDRPHYFKLDGYYTFDLREAGNVVTGLSFRALSGTPINASGGHYRYGPDETMLLPRGSMGRIGFDYNASLHVAYSRDIGRGMRLEGWVDFFNLTAFDFFKGQGTASVNERYTRYNVNPVVGGSYEDLIYLKELDDAGTETGAPARRNRDFGNARALYAAPSARLGARLTF